MSKCVLSTVRHVEETIFVFILSVNGPHRCTGEGGRERERERGGGGGDIKKVHAHV